MWHLLYNSIIIKKKSITKLHVYEKGSLLPLHGASFTVKLPPLKILQIREVTTVLFT